MFVFTFTLVTAINVNIASSAVSERIQSASSLVRARHEQEMTLDYALKALGSKVPKPVMAMLKHAGKQKKFLGSLFQEGLGFGVDKQDWSQEELDRAKEILNKMYEQEESDLDVTVVDCDRFQAAVSLQLNDNIRIRVLLGQETANARAAQLTSTMTIKEARTELAGLQDSYSKHQETCTSTLNAARAQLAIMEFDYNVAMKIKNMSECDDAAIQAAETQDEEAEAEADAAAATSFIGMARSFRECRHSAKEEPIWEFAGMVHQEAGYFKSKAAKFAMQRMAKLAMQRKLGKHHYRYYSLVQGKKVFSTEAEEPTTTPLPAGPSIDVSSIASSEEEPVRAGTPKELDPPGTKCNVNDAPNCPLLNDAVNTMVGEIKDELDVIKHHVDMTQKHCDQIASDYEAQIADWEGTLDKSQINLAEAIQKINTHEESSRQKLNEFNDLSKELNDKMDECATKKQELTDTMCAIKTVRLELFHMAQKQDWFADCEVGDWVPAECTAQCGGGTQSMTRSVVTQPVGGAGCPPLSMAAPCNDVPCPIDCVMGDWSGWSTCSKDCGGGIEVRNRAVLTKMLHKGKTCEATDETRMCGEPCDVPCELEDWSDWSSCSKACDAGIQSRRKYMYKPAIGEGTCANDDSELRFEERPCNDLDCPDNLVCNFKMDLVLLLDSSGSVRYRGFKREKIFADKLIERTNMGEDGAKVGIIRYSSKVDIISQMSFDKEMLEGDVKGTKWSARSTNTAEALSRAMTLLNGGGRVDADSVVFVLTDGMPNDSEATGMMAEKLKQQARLIFVAVGKNLHMDSLYQWASFPPEQNVLTAKGFYDVIRKLPNFIADICPKMECREDFTGDGADYIGCQAQTVTGKACQKWSEKSPHAHRHGEIGKHNFCRNPDGEPSIWCYTTDPNVRWEHCVPRDTTSWN